MLIRVAVLGVVITVATAFGTGAAGATTTTTVASATTTTEVAPATTTIAATTTTTATVATTSTTARRAVVTHRQARASVQLAGLVALTAGTCTGTPSGTYFRMLQPGSPPNGPASGYLANADSPCADKTYTPLTPGTDGGLTLGAYQPEPAPAFDTKGNSLAARIVQPASFFGVHFSLSTAAVDPQTGVAVTAPSLTLDGATVGGDLRSLGASWNKGHFNQGSPKPDGATPARTTLPTGTYDAATGAITVEWTSAIVGGPFDGFTGEWHLAGTVAAAAPPTTAVGSAPIVAASTATISADPGLANTGSDGSALVVVGILLLAVGTSATALAGQGRRGSRTS